MTKKRGPYSSPRQQERRERILRTAGALIEKQGFTAISMQGIAEVSEVSTKTLYNLFGSLDLLLLEVTTMRLSNLQRSIPVIDSEPGIPQLIAFTAGSMKLFEDRPELARSVISIQVRAELEQDDAYERFGPVLRFAYASLCTAAEDGELREGIDLRAVSFLISAHQWGAVLLWEKGLLQVGQLKAQVTLSNYLTLIPICVGKRKKSLELALEKHLQNTSPMDPAMLQLSRNTEQSGLVDLKHGEASR